MNRIHALWCGLLVLLIALPGTAAEKSTPDKKEDAAPPGITAGATADDAPILVDEGYGEFLVQEMEDTDIVVGSKESLILPNDADVIALVYREGDELLVYSLEGEEKVQFGDDGQIVLPHGEVIHAGGEALAVRGGTAPGHYRFDGDAADKKGFIAYVRAGYQWNFLRKTGFEVAGNRMSRNVSMSGANAVVGVGYNFGVDVPIGLEFDVGIGPRIAFSNRRQFGDTFIDAKQKLSFYFLDVNIDYDIKTNTCWTPFIGITTGVTLVTERGRMAMDTGAHTAFGEYKRKHRVNLLGGLRAGIKYELTDRMTISAVAAYSYIGDVPSQHFILSDGTRASTNRVKAHELSLKLGLQMQF